MTAHLRLAEEQWAAAVAAAEITLEGAVAPVRPPAGPAPEAALRHLTLLGAADVTVDLLAARGRRGWAARLGGDAIAHACAVRTLITGRPDGRIGIVPGVELSQGTAGELLGSVLRLIPGLAPGAAHPAVVTVPTAHVGAAIEAAREESPRLRAALLDLLGWEDLPVEVASLTRIDGDVTLAIAAPGRRTRIIRLLHGHEGWVSISVGRHGISYRMATTTWLTAELTWELAASLEAAR